MNNKTQVNKRPIKIATYNILLSRHTKDLIKNIVKLAEEGAAVICLQEVLKNEGESFIIDKFLQNLGKNWEARYHLGMGTDFLDFGTCIIWNKQVLKLKKVEKILPPTIDHLTFHELIFHKLAGLAAVTPPRRAISCLFEYKNTNIVIASIHLDSVGGTNNRMRQLQYLLKQFNKQSKSHHTIVCGDFNSFDLLNTGAEKERSKALFGDMFVDASKNISWSADLYKMDTPKKFPWFVELIKVLNVHVKRKLDYIWVKNFEVIECKIIDLPGSDHLPIVAILVLK